MAILPHSDARTRHQRGAAQCVAHDVLVVVRHDHRSRSGASIRDHLDPRVAVVEIPGRWFTQRRLCRALRDWRPDVVHAHLRRATRLLSRCRIDAARAQASSRWMSRRTTSSACRRR